MKKLLYMLAGTLMLAGFGTVKGEFNNAQKLGMAEKAIELLYVDTVNADRLVEDAIKGMLEGLDPHSQYSSAEETRQLNEPLEGNFSGIGITFNMTQDTLYVIQTVAGGPSERVGILAGDRIIAVNDTNIAGIKMKNTDIMKRLRGPKGTDVDVTVLRYDKAIPDTIGFRITRDDIPIYSVDAAYMVEPGIGYIRLNKFAAETSNEFVKAVSDLKKHGMKDLILDLVDNGGGYLNAAVEILSELLPEESLAVYTEGMRSPRTNLTTKPKGKNPLLPNGRLVVMANQYSASSSEITSGAIQDWDRGLIVGRRTYGKGLVQRPIPFPDGSMIRLTVAHYYTPTGRNIQKPYELGGGKKYAKDILDRYNGGELMHADSIKYIDSLKTETIKLQRPIYGGGGIYPDKFVPLDTTEYTKYYRNLVAKGVINKYVIKYVDKNRKDLLKQYRNDDIFTERFEVTSAMLSDLFELGKAEGVEINEEEAAKSAPLFSMIVKALIARDVYDNPSYFKVYNRYDPIFKSALELIKSKEYDELLSAPEN